ncbi:uncharacterized protein Z518_04142 [Rhinocladiella mackenziei CBS 650.93]|uniref:Uncharacterized protein n=1 Tax=Rhinocladiella mackenziei CBS 650.93 TaxID=1442369 RepID=A0A0D2H6X9_9EURO|nr:uncharacterized protein Z518_04142 [Rhinocladiella mackenziei CBS 650.93]KIX06168.1 hypothetical protein Z518_04142 [Rhinocladiella mackenziei CBS 650.93]
MKATDHPWPLVTDTSVPAGKLTWKAAESDIPSWKTPTKLIDENSYNTTVLRLASTMSEDDLDDQVALEAQSLGLPPLQVTSEGNGVTSSISAVTVASDPINQSSIQSQSTASTSCASSEHRLATESSFVSGPSPTKLESPEPASEAEKRRSSPFRRGFQKMAGFRRKKSVALASSTLASISSDADTNNSDNASVDMKSPSSIKSSKSSWSQPLSASKSSWDQPAPADPDALRRSMECKDLLNLRMAQLEEKARFLEFQASLIDQLRSQRDNIKTQRATEHEKTVAEQRQKNDRAVEDLEARQLEEEMKMQKEHDLEKRTVMVRLRHMEAYCQNPTPLPTLVDPASGRPSIDSGLPKRTVTDKDYHNLAQQYRERDAMDTLHASKINVLRGKQKKAVENLVWKKDRGIDALKQEQKKELAAIDRDFAGKEANLKLAFGEKRTRIENRWKTRVLIERTKLERATGLKYAPLPDVTAVEEAPAAGETV